jgi:hypothetical protein
MIVAIGDLILAHGRKWHDTELKNIDVNCYGICSDFVQLIKDKL